MSKRHIWNNFNGPNVRWPKGYCGKTWINPPWDSLIMVLTITSNDFIREKINEEDVCEECLKLSKQDGVNLIK